MKTNRNRTLYSTFLMTAFLLLSVSAALADDIDGRADKCKFRGRVEVAFTKWLTNGPNMAGVVSGDVGGGLFKGKILKVETAGNVFKIEAVYHINGGAFQFTAHNFVTETDVITDKGVKGSSVIHGVVTDGPMKGARVRGEYQVINPCGIMNAQNGEGGDFCYQGTLTVTPE
jgi:hypothetical protein